jgi:hypothetical protein
LRVKGEEDAVLRNEAAAAARSEAAGAARGFTRPPATPQTATRGETTRSRATLDDVLSQLREQQDAQAAGFEKVAVAVTGEGEKTRAQTPPSFENAVDRYFNSQAPRSPLQNADLPVRQPGLGPMGRGT